MLAVAICSPAALAAAGEGFDLAAYRVRVATDRAAGIEEGRHLLASGAFAHDVESRRLVLWYMGGAAIGDGDDQALAAVLADLDALFQQQSDGVAGSYAGFLRAAENIESGRDAEGLIQALEAANLATAQESTALRITAAGELCRDFSTAGQAARALPHCQRHTRLVRETGDLAALGRAEYLEASALRQADQWDDAIVSWQRARQHFREAGLDGLAARTAGSLATDLVHQGRYEEARAMAREALVEARKTGSAISIVYALRVLAEAQLGLEQLDEARTSIEEAIALDVAEQRPGLAASLLQLQADMRHALGEDSDEVEALRARAQELKPGLDQQSEEAHTELSLLEARYREREQELRIRALENENRERELALDRVLLEAERRQVQLSHQRQLIGLGSLIGILLLGGLFVLVKLLRAQRRLARVLRIQATHDALTGLPNRRALDDAVGELLADPATGSREHVLMVIDVDHFKAINDHYGHPFGDTVLVAIAHRLTAVLDGCAQLARVGGEEFVALCPDRDLSAGLELAEELLAAVAALELHHQGRHVPVTISIGLAKYAAAMPGFAAWLGAADAALYRAKQAGRNRVALSDDDQDPQPAPVRPPGQGVQMD